MASSTSVSGRAIPRSESPRIKSLRPVKQSMSRSHSSSSLGLGQSPLRPKSRSGIDTSSSNRKQSLNSPDPGSTLSTSVSSNASRTSRPSRDSGTSSKISPTPRPMSLRSDSTLSPSKPRHQQLPSDSSPRSSQKRFSADISRTESPVSDSRPGYFDGQPRKGSNGSDLYKSRHQHSPSPPPIPPQKRYSRDLMDSSRASSRSSQFGSGRRQGSGTGSDRSRHQYSPSAPNPSSPHKRSSFVWSSSASPAVSSRPGRFGSDGRVSSGTDLDRRIQEAEDKIAIPASRRSWVSMYSSVSPIKVSPQKVDTPSQASHKPPTDHTPAEKGGDILRRDGNVEVSHSVRRANNNRYAEGEESFMSNRNTASRQRQTLPTHHSNEDTSFASLDQVIGGSGGHTLRRSATLDSRGAVSRTPAGKEVAAEDLDRSGGSAGSKQRKPLPSHFRTNPGSFVSLSCH